MVIGLDLLFLRKKIDGRGRYSINLIRNLQLLDFKNKYILFLNEESYNLIEITNKNFKKILYFKGNYKFFKRIYFQNKLYFMANKYGLDIIHILDPTLIFFRKVVTILTVHDLIEYNIPWKYDKFRVFYRKHLIPLWIKYNVDYIITVSNNTKDDIIKHWHKLKCKFRTIYLGIDEKFYSNKKLVDVITKYNLPEENYLLYVGNLEPGKNIKTLLKAYELYKNRGGMKKLVIVGSKKWLYSPIVKSINNNLFKSDIILTGYVDDYDLPFIYKNSYLFIYPSYYEGFGLPNLEAMSQGVPIVSSNVSSIPEVVGNIGILINPYSAEDIMNAIFKYENDVKLYEQISKASLQHVKKFNFKNTAINTINVYKDALASYLKGDS